MDTPEPPLCTTSPGPGRPGLLNDRSLTWRRRCPPSLLPSATPLAGASGSAVPATPRWLLAIPDAIRQLAALDREVLTRRDVEQLFGVSRARAATLMQTFGAELTGNQRTLPRTQLLRQLRRHRTRAAFRGEADRRERLLTELRTARLTGIRVAVPVEALEGRLASQPEGVNVARDRIEVRFSGAQDAVARLFALAQALTNDYEQFEALVEVGEAAGGGGAGRA